MSDLFWVAVGVALATALHQRERLKDWYDWLRRRTWGRQ